MLSFAYKSVETLFKNHQNVHDFWWDLLIWFYFTVVLRYNCRSRRDFLLISLLHIYDNYFPLPAAWYSLFLGRFFVSFWNLLILVSLLLLSGLFFARNSPYKKARKNNQSPHLVWLLIVVGTHFVKVHTFMGIAEYAEVIQHA